jgi:hypothetical protein
MRTAYDPTRIGTLTHRTSAAIDALSMVRSFDPASTDAMRSVRLLRRNLEDHWMPLLRQIETSRAMIDWTASTLTAVHQSQMSIAQWLEDVTANGTTMYADLTDEELIELLVSIDAELPMRRDGNDWEFDRGRWIMQYGEIAEELARRVGRDPQFGKQLSAIADVNPSIGLAIGVADFPPSFMRDVARAMFHNNSYSVDFSTEVDLVALSGVLEALMEHPAGALELLDDDIVLRELSGWGMLDEELIADFVRVGLYDSVAADPTLLEDGYEVIKRLVVLANGDLTEGFDDGLSIGLASSMIGYVDTLAQGLDSKTGPVIVTKLGDEPFQIKLGTYDEVRNLFGAIARNPQAQTALGLTIGAFTNSVVDRLGSELGEQSGIDDVARFADLIGDGVSAEQAEMMAAAADAEMQLGQVLGIASSAIGVGVSLAAFGPITSAVIGGVISLSSSWLSNVDSKVMPNSQLCDLAFDAIYVNTVRLARNDATTKREHGLIAEEAEHGPTIDAYLGELEAINSDLAKLGDSDRDIERGTQLLEQRELKLAELRTYIESTDEIDAFVKSVMDLDAVQELHR